MQQLPTLGPKGEGWVALQVAVLGATGLAGLAGLAAPTWGGWMRLLTTVIGVALMAMGFRQALRGIRDLGPNLTPVPHPTETARLVEHGIYGRVRHPIYGGLILGSAGWALATASLPALALVPVVIGFFTLKSTVEERWLAERFPGYAAYRSRTRRFLSGPG